MYHILAAQRQRQYGPFGWKNQPFAGSAADPRPNSLGLIESAPTIRSRVRRVKQQTQLTAAGGRLDTLGSSDQRACPSLEAEPVERGLAKRGFDPFRQVVGNGQLVRLEGAQQGAPEFAPGLRLF